MEFDPFGEEFFKRFFRRLKDSDRGFEDMEKKFKIDFREFECKPRAAGFKIEIRDFGTGKPEVKVMRIGGPSAKVTPVVPKSPRPELHKSSEKRGKIKPISHMLETNVGKIERPDEVVLTMEMPGVKKEDVELRPLGSTLEIIARKPSGGAYFAAFELPPDVAFNMKNIEIKGEMLVISIPRRRRPPTRL